MFNHTICNSCSYFSHQNPIMYLNILLEIVDILLYIE